MIWRWVTVEKLSELTGVPIGTIRDWIKKGKLLATTLDDESRRVFVDASHFNATLDQRLEEVAMERLAAGLLLALLMVILLVVPGYA